MKSIWLCALLSLAPVAAGADSENVVVGERPAVHGHLDQADVDSGAVNLAELIVHGEMLFSARFNTLDGQGRPGCTGTGDLREPDQPAFIRTSAPESNSCAGCHSQPRPGGAGDFVSNVFVLAQALDPVTSSVAPEISNERNTLGMMGAGPIEMLAREMSTELIAIRTAAAAAAAQSAEAVTRALTAKGVDFGAITVMPDGRVDPTAIEGVDWDLIIKPFHQKGAVVSIREFTNNALNHHHGMQSVERFGENTDEDLDGVPNELTSGDVTALTIFQAALNTPGYARPQHPVRRQAAEAGEALFTEIGCSTCHIPSLTLDSRDFSEPNPFNPPGNLRPEHVPAPFTFDMTKEGPKPRLEKIPGGGAVIRAFTDLKRHNLNDEELNHYANEQLHQGLLTGFAAASDFTVAAEPRPTEVFLTRKLWDVGNTDPYGHRGDLTTLTEAVYYHGGEGRAAREAFFALPQEDRDAIIEFLKALQIQPN